MNWKLLFIVLTCAIVGISARPSDETKPIEITQPPTTATASATTTIREEKPTTTKSAAISAASVTSPATIRYLQASPMPTKHTNSKLKYSNNYANLITKYTLMNSNNNFNHNNNRNVSSDNSNKYVNLHGIVVGSSLPLANTIVKSTETTSNSSSKPIVFLSADETTTLKSTTKREYHPPLKLNIVTPWPNQFDYEHNLISTARPNKKPVIHKILSKWSDNPQDVFIGNKNDYDEENDFNVFSTRWPKPNPHIDVEDLKNNLIQNVFLPDLVSSSSFNGMGQVGHDIMMNPFGSSQPAILKNKNKLYANNQETRPTKCKTTKIKVGNNIVNQHGPSSKENCDEIELQIENNVKNTNAVTQSSNEEMYDFSINDKFQDVLGFNSESGEKQNVVLSEDIPQIVNSINDIRQPLSPTQTGLKDDGENKRKKKKKPAQSQNQIDYEDDGFSTMIPSMIPSIDEGADMGSMMMTMMTMMAIFNPLNFGVWGIIVAPFAAVLLTGVAYGMFHVLGMKQHVAPWPQPAQELLVKSKIVHSPIPIKVIHKHPIPTAPAMNHYMFAQPPMQAYGVPATSYGVPDMFMNSYDRHMRQKGKNNQKRPQKQKHFAEPPMLPMEEYYPSAPAGGPYKRKTNYRFKLKGRPVIPIMRHPVTTLQKLQLQKFKLL